MPRVLADVRVWQVAGHWLASADTPDGPSLGLGRHPAEALADGLQPFDGYVDEPLATVPDDLYWRDHEGFQWAR